MLDTATGDKNYPGSSKSSDNWPGIAPGETGVNNAISPKYCELEAITEIDPDEKPPVLWIRGDSDQIVSNASLFDLGTLGRMDELPEWPGEDVFPPQPMVGQTRAVLERYADRGGEFEEVVFGNVGHTPHVEVPGTFWIGSSPSCRAGSRGSGVVQRPELCSGTPSADASSSRSSVAPSLRIDRSVDSPRFRVTPFEIRTPSNVPSQCSSLAPRWSM